MFCPIVSLDNPRLFGKFGAQKKDKNCTWYGNIYKLKLSHKGKTVATI